MAMFVVVVTMLLLELQLWFCCEQGLFELKACARLQEENKSSPFKIHAKASSLSAGLAATAAVHRGRSRTECLTKP